MKLTAHQREILIYNLTIIYNCRKILDIKSIPYVDLQSFKRKRRIPTIGELSKLCSELDIKLYWLINRKINLKYAFLESGGKND